MEAERLTVGAAFSRPFPCPVSGWQSSPLAFRIMPSQSPVIKHIEKKPDMEIAYDPDNLAGAERYLIQSGVADPDSVRTWIEQKTIEQLDRQGAKGREFPVLHRGIGFFWEITGYTNAPKFSVSIPDKDAGVAGSSDLVSVAYWVAADVVPA
ncbi:MULTISPECIES: hypothetical protein [Rhodobacterales]|uniref:hypothetical protein n=1 Tax=Rhodobacterales TaxID=204455 RepID=UPI00105748BB|nr:MULTISPECIES: hypothetical protein [Rhodobacterales]